MRCPLRSRISVLYEMLEDAIGVIGVGESNDKKVANRATNGHKALHRKLQIEQHKPY